MSGTFDFCAHADTLSMQRSTDQSNRAVETISSTRALQIIYAEPQLHELIALCQQFELVVSHEMNDSEVTLLCQRDVYTLKHAEAELLLRGLLLGFFHRRTKDDLSLALWA